MLTGKCQCLSKPFTQRQDVFTPGSAAADALKRQVTLSMERLRSAGETGFRFPNLYPFFAFGFPLSRWPPCLRNQKLAWDSGTSYVTHLFCLVSFPRLPHGRFQGLLSLRSHCPAETSQMVPERRTRFAKLRQQAPTAFDPLRAR